ncbi:MAG: EthD family reductase [Pseudomonadota bacterium]
MAVTLQVIYPNSDGTSFDHGYYGETHLPLVGQHMGAHIESTLVTKGVSDPGGNTAAVYAIASMVFVDKPALEAALAKAGPVIEDIPNFTNTVPQMVIGETL